MLFPNSPSRGNKAAANLRLYKLEHARCMHKYAAYHFKIKVQIFISYIYIYIYIYAIANASQLPARVRADSSVEPCDTKRLSLSLLLTGSRRGRSIESSLERRCRLNLNYKLAQASEVATVTNTMTDSGRNQPHCQVTGESRWADPRARQL